MTKIVLFIVFSFFFSTYASNTPIIDYKYRAHPVLGKKGMVATQDQYASIIGSQILSKGGNAIDAAVAVGFALSVSLPRAGNLGGGGFMLIYISSENHVVALDYREKAPIKASQNMFLLSDSTVDVNRSKSHIWSTGVPGTVHGLISAWEKYGSLPLKDLMTPAIKLAKNGIIVSQDFASSLILSKARLRKNGNSNFFKADGSLYEYGDKFKQPDLAWALKQIARNGKKAFYEGKIADKIIALMNQTGGLISSEDLKNYSCVWRTPISGTFKEYTVFSMPPPSSGGIHLIQLLKILERFDLKKMGLNSAEYIHHLSEAMKLVYADRFKYLGDSDFVKIPVSYLLSKDYIDDISRRISLSSRIDTLSLINKNDTEMLNESPETTHYSIVDQWGNAVSNTYTLNFSYGNGIVVPGAGFLLNNQMDDFTVKPGSPNAYGLIGGYSNAIEPEKRMLSSMTPTLVFKNNNVFLVTGTPGGSKIITMVLQQIINTTVFNMNLAEATVMPRFHHQWIPDTVFVETGFSKDTVDKLRLMGHRVILVNASGSMQSIMIGEGMLYGYSDPRKPGAMSVGN